MSFQNVRSVSMTVLSASADIPQRRFVTWKVTTGLTLPATANDSDTIVGVTLEGYDDSTADLGESSDTVPVALLDGAIMEVEAGAAVTQGARIIAGNDGRAIVSTTTAGGTVPAGDYQEVGIALTAASAAGEIITFVSLRGPIVTTS